MATKDIQAGNYGAMVRITDDCVAMIFPTSGKPVKAAQIQAEKKAGKETGWYIVPKNYLYGQGQAKLPNGSRVSATWTLPIPMELRKQAFEAAVAKGLKVRPLEEEKEEAPKNELLFSELLTELPTGMKLD